MTIEFDPTRRNGRVSENVLTHFSFNPSKFEIGIIIYEKNITEDILAHEALHAQKLVHGHPFFIPGVAFLRNPKLIANLEKVPNFVIPQLLKYLHIEI